MGTNNVQVPGAGHRPDLPAEFPAAPGRAETGFKIPSGVEQEYVLRRPGVGEFIQYGDQSGIRLLLPDTTGPEGPEEFGATSLKPCIRRNGQYDGAGKFQSQGESSAQTVPDRSP
jgi:hypothetical protein